MESTPNPAAQPAPVFAAELKPHRSLGPRGFAILMAVVAGVNFAAGALFWAKGAWPVFGFCGLDVAAVFLAFRYNYRQARAREYLSLDDEEIGRASCRERVCQYV